MKNLYKTNLDPRYRKNLIFRHDPINPAPSGRFFEHKLSLQNPSFSPNSAAATDLVQTPNGSLPSFKSVIKAKKFQESLKAKILLLRSRSRSIFSRRQNPSNSG